MKKVRDKKKSAEAFASLLENLHSPKSEYNAASAQLVGCYRLMAQMVKNDVSLPKAERARRSKDFLARSREIERKRDRLNIAGMKLAKIIRKSTLK